MCAPLPSDGKPITVQDYKLALAKGKKSWDKRHALAERQATRETQQAVGRRLKGMD